MKQVTIQTVWFLDRGTNYSSTAPWSVFQLFTTVKIPKTKHKVLFKELGCPNHLKSELARFARSPCASASKPAEHPKLP